MSDQIAVTTEQATKMLSVSKSTLYELAKRPGSNLRPIKLGRATRWSVEQLRQLVTQASQTTTA